MATILLTDEEYNHIKGALDDLLKRVENASPRAATHYSNIAKLHATFLSREDGKRAAAQTKTSARTSLLKAKEVRRAGGASGTRPSQTPPQGATRPGGSAKSA